MSIAIDCPGCVAGNHEQHDAGHGLRSGVIGGHYCACSGDCSDRAVACESIFTVLARPTGEADERCACGHDPGDHSPNGTCRFWCHTTNTDEAPGGAA